MMVSLPVLDSFGSWGPCSWDRLELDSLSGLTPEAGTKEELLEELRPLKPQQSPC